MDYFVNSASFSSAFTIPSVITDRYLKLANSEHIKVILYILRNMSKELTEKVISEQTGVAEYDVKEALLYWADAGILLPKSPEKADKKPKSSVGAVSKSLKPGRTDIAKRGLEDPKIRFLLTEAQMKFGRNLKTNETSTLVWLYEDEGLDVSLILLIIQYAVRRERCNIRFIESVALDWVENGIDSVSLADAELAKITESEQAWSIVQSAFGIERRLPSKKEKELSFKWIAEWKISKELLRCAYEACVDTKSKFSMPYTAKIIESWHNKGYKKPEDIKSENEKATDGDKYAAYDLNIYEKMLNSKD